MPGEPEHMGFPCRELAQYEEGLNVQVLQESFEDVLGDLPEQILSHLLATKLKAQGQTLSKRDQGRIVRHILAGNTVPVKLREWQFWKKGEPITLAFTAEDLARIGHIADTVTEKLPEIIDSAAVNVASDLLSTLKKRWSRELGRQKKELDGFRRRLEERWGPGIGLLRMLLTISREFGESLNQETRARPSDGSRYRVEVLTRLHARGCQVVEEILALLSTGLADGAMARWRTLHEVTVVALFISKHGEGLSERYFLHQYVESKKAATKYAVCYERLGHDALAPEEAKLIDERYDAVIARYGADFRTDYGWASEALGNRNPNFDALEASVGLDHWRAHYRMAGHNVHANPKGAFFKLGLLDETNMLLAGPSNAGLADPGHSAAVSLDQLSSALLVLQTTFDNLVALRTMLLLEREIGEAFFDADQRLKEDEVSYQDAQ